MPDAPQLTPFSLRLRRRANVVLVGVALLVPFVVHGARQSIDKMRITPEKWVDKTSSARQIFERFRSEFEGNDAVYVTWQGCTIDDPRLLEFERQLLGANSLGEHLDINPYEKVITGTGTLAAMMDRPLRLERADALERLSGFLVGPDGKTSCAVVVLTYEGNEHRRETIAQVKKIAASVVQVPIEEIIIAGPPHDGIAIDDASIRGVNIFGTLSTLVSALLCFYCLRSVRIAGVILGIACLGQGIVLSAIHYSGLTLDAILIVSPPLIFVLTVSTGIHFVNYFRSQPESLDDQTALEHACKEAWKPCGLAVLTTSIGLSSLAISRIAPIAAFGGYSAAALAMTIFLLMCLLPDALRKWPVSRSESSERNSSTGLHHLSQWVTTNSYRLSASFIVVIIFALFGVQRIQTSVDPTSLFHENSKILQDYNWIESRIGASVPVEAIVRFEPDAEQNISERVDVIREVHRRIEEVSGIEGVMSAITFLPADTSLNPDDSRIRMAITNRRLYAARQDLDLLNYFFEDEKSQAWRVTGRVFATEGMRYDAIGRRIRKTMDAFLASDQEITSGVSVQYSGMMPLIEDVQVTILDDLQRSLMMAFALIGLAILVVIRNLRVAVIVTVLNTFPVLVIFGMMGGSAIPIDIGTMMTAGVAMGIAVDDTVHFLCFYRNRLAEGAKPSAAVRTSIQTCGTAMLQTSLICCAGMLVFSSSSFIPTQQFGLIMAAILVAAIVSDLVFLPALLLVGQNWKLWSNTELTPAPDVIRTGSLAK